MAEVVDDRVWDIIAIVVEVIEATAEAKVEMVEGTAEDAFEGDLLILGGELVAGPER